MLMNSYDVTARDKIVYIKVESDNNIIKGWTTNGNLNIEGNSSTRRSCNINLSTLESIDVNSWPLNKNFSLSIGIEVPGNELVWNSQGEYILTSFNVSESLNSITINLSGQDKMCRLTGEVGGIINAETYFDSIDEEQANGDIIRRKLPLDEIIKNVLMVYANESKFEIDLNQAKDSAYNKMEYRGDKPLYLMIQQDEENKLLIKNLTVFGDQEIENATSNKVSLKDLEPEYFWQPSILSAELPSDQYNVRIGAQNYILRKINYGESAGYQQTDLIYPGDLVVAAGEPVSNVLNKIRDMLGNYEYYYKTDGTFYFGPKKNYIERNTGEYLIQSEGWNSVGSSLEEGDIVFDFGNDKEIITSLSVSPDIKNIKNDFTVWGTRKSVTGQELPIHARVAIQQKPTRYVSPYQMIDEQNIIYDIDNYDYREIIYQMARDYYNHNQEADFLARVQEANTLGKEIFYPGGRTGYEQYYTDLLGFWRDLYDPAKGREEKKEWARVDYREDNVFYHPWIKISSLDTLNTYNPDEIYVQRVNTDGNIECYVPWIDSLNLNDYSAVIGQPTFGYRLDKLYYYDEKTGIATPVLHSVSLEKDIQYFSSNNVISLLPFHYALNLADQLKIVYINSKTKDKVKFLKQIDLHDYTSTSQYMDKIYIYDSDLQEYIEIYELKYIDKNDNEQTITAKNYKNHANYIKNTAEYKKNNEDTSYTALKEGDYVSILLCTTQLQDNNYFPYIDQGEEEILLIHYITEIMKKRSVQEYYEFIRGLRFSKAKMNANPLFNFTIPNRNKLSLQRVGEEDHIYYLRLKDCLLDYYIEDENYFVKSSDYEINTTKQQFEIYYLTNLKGELILDTEYNREIQYFKQINNYQSDGEYKYWNNDVLEASENLNFWFELIDDEELLNKYGVSIIGSRPFVKTESGVKAIYYNSNAPIKYGTMFNLPKQFAQIFTISTQGISALEMLTEYIYSHTFFSTGITINCLPITYLEPNTLIKLEDKIYNIKSISLPLSYNGTMTISASILPTGKAE